MRPCTTFSNRPWFAVEPRGSALVASACLTLKLDFLVFYKRISWGIAFNPYASLLEFQFFDALYVWYYWLYGGWGSFGHDIAYWDSVLSGCLCIEDLFHLSPETCPLFRSDHSPSSQERLPFSGLWVKSSVSLECGWGGNQSVTLWCRSLP